MITQFYNTLSRELVGQPREGWYMVDGQPGVLPPELIQVEHVYSEQPTLIKNQVATQTKPTHEEIVESGQYVHGWTVSTVEPQPWRVGKGTIMDRIEAAGALTGVMAVFSAQSAEDQFRWTNNPWFWSTNTTLRQPCAALGLDADAILAPDPFL